MGIWMKKTEHALQKKTAPAVQKRGWRGRIVNLLGILSAFGIALGGLFLVQNRLEWERESLLLGDGIVEIAVQSEAAEAMEISEADAVRKKLTEKELMEVVYDLENGENVYPHEPEPGQLSMAQAIECGREWVEDFFMPHLGVQDFQMEEYKADCFLWSFQGTGEERVISGEGASAGGSLPDGKGTEAVRSLGYWTVMFEVQGLAEVGLTLDAGSGQVLVASMGLYSPVEYQDEDKLSQLLWDYADSFGKGEEALYSVVGVGGDSRENNSWAMYQQIGAEELYATIETSSIAVSRAGNSSWGDSYRGDGGAEEDGILGSAGGAGAENSAGNKVGIIEYTEIFYIRLYLTTDYSKDTRPGGGKR